ncbi:MAG: tRNA 2-thiocytidine biosynthesis TtcA family protein [Candidatus Edwardsbacteria bacterium]|nr:tRNA 2-thiocytidine biosynthesis TtcA family protein [Candidatus Edwardsbacteria bacterium]
MSRRPDNWNTIYSRVLKAEHDFGMLGNGDRVLIGLSGGADSLTLLDMLARQQKILHRKLGITVVAGHVPGRYKGKPIALVATLQTIRDSLRVVLHISPGELKDDAFKDCFVCSHARRKLLFDLAESQRCNKIALGHNADDMVETALLNILYAGRFAALHPRQPLFKGKLTVIRPLSYLWKSQITGYCRQRFGKIRQFKCPGGAASKRIMIRKLLTRLEKDGSPVRANLLGAIANPKPEYLPVLPR